MTGIDGRDEFIFEGSNDNKTWLAYEFYYKPGNNLTETPLITIPH